MISGYGLDWLNRRKIADVIKYRRILHSINKDYFPAHSLKNKDKY